MLLQTPTDISSEILDFAAAVVPGGTPAFVALDPQVGGTPNECFGNVAQQVVQFGGGIQHGWAIWEWRYTLLEAEFHAVWRRPDGSLLDVTPRNDSESTILFVEDPRRKFRGVAVDNVRLPLRNDPRILEFIELAAYKYEILNRGERRHQFGAVSVPRDEFTGVVTRMLQLQNELASPNIGRNDPCYCGSGVKFKRCHGSLRS